MVAILNGQILILRYRPTSSRFVKVFKNKLISDGLSLFLFKLLLPYYLLLGAILPFVTAIIGFCAINLWPQSYVAAFNTLVVGLLLCVLFCFIVL